MAFPKFFLITSSTIAVPGIIFGGLWINKTIRSRIESINLLKEHYKILGDEYVELQKEKHGLEGEISELKRKINNSKADLSLIEWRKKIKNKETISKDIKDFEEQLSKKEEQHSKRIEELDKRLEILETSIKKTKEKLQKESINVEDIEWKFRSSKFFFFTHKIY